MITIPTGQLVGLLGDALLFACPDDDYPAIHAVRLEWDSGMLHALATDRYHIGWSTWAPDDDPDTDQQESLFTDWGGADDPWQISIPAPDAKDIAAMFKLPRKEAWTPLTVDYDQARHRVRIARSRDTGHSAITAMVDGAAGPFPDLRELLAKAETNAAPTGEAAYTATRLAAFGKVRQRGPMTMQFAGPHGVTSVQIGDRFRGAIMPVKLADDQGEG